VRAHLKRETRQIDAILFSVNATVPDFAPLFTKHVTSAVDEAGLAAVAEIGVGVWDLSDPGVIEWIKTQGLTKATIVLETTRDALRQTVAQGLEAGEGIRELAKRIRAVFDVASTSRAQAIARTEVNTAANYGRVQGYRQTGVVEGKEWITARDERVRVTHKAADKQTVGLHEDFQVGAGSGPAPGQIGLAEEDINCRCTLKAVLMGKRRGLRNAHTGRTGAGHGVHQGRLRLGLWGEVILSFKHGALVGARKTQTFLAEDVLRPKRGRSTQEGH